MAKSFFCQLSRWRDGSVRYRGQEKACGELCSYRNKVLPGQTAPWMAVLPSVKKGEKIMGRVSDKVAIVTGAGSGLGQAEAVMLAKEGAKVAVTDVNDVNGSKTVRMIQDTGGEA